MKRGYYFIVILFLIGCGGVSDNPSVNLPVPFAGAVTGDTNILIASGNPVGGSNLSLNLASKNQTVAAVFPKSWEMVDGSLLGPCGTLTFHSMTEPIVAPLDRGIEQREYFMDASLQGSDVQFEIRTNMQCIENRTPYTPTQETLDLAASLSESADVRKLACSGLSDCVCPGNVDCDKTACVEDQAINLNMVVDVIGGRIFNTQRESNLIFDSPSGGGALFCAGNGSEPSDKVIMTMVVQGFVTYLPKDSVPGAPPVDQLALFSVYLPGSDTPSGTYLHHTHGTTGTLDESGQFLIQFTTAATGDIRLNDGSFLRIRNMDYEHTYVPEFDDIFSEIIDTTPFFRQDIHFDDLVFARNGGKAYHQTAGGTLLGTINFDPAAGEATGIFRALFDANGAYTIQSRCLVMTATSTRTNPPPDPLDPPYNLMPLIFTLTKE